MEEEQKGTLTSYETSYESRNHDDHVESLDGIDPESREAEDQPAPTLTIPLKYCTFEVWKDQRTVATVFPDGYICAGSRVDTQQNRIEAESQGYATHDRVWRSLVDHELLHNVIAEVMFDRISHVMATESGLEWYPSWLRYEEEAIVLAYQYFINTGRQPDLLYKYPQGVYEAWMKEYAPKLAASGIWGLEIDSCIEE